MAVKVGSARIDENGRAHGGKAGDQTGKELSVQSWYRHSKGWRVLRCTDSAKAEKIAAAMEAACRNRNIGYDQYERLTLYNLAKAVGQEVHGFLGLSPPRRRFGHAYAGAYRRGAEQRQQGGLAES